MTAQPHRQDEAEAEEKRQRRQEEKDLDKALQDSFPASDPPAITQPTPTPDADDKEKGKPRRRSRVLLRCAGSRGPAERRDQGTKRDPHHVDVGDRQRDVSGQHDTARQKPVEQVDERDLSVRERGGAHVRSRCSLPANE